MSAWLEAAKEVHTAGGVMPVKAMWSMPEAVRQARRYGLLEPASGRGGNMRRHTAVLSKLGRDVIEGRAEFHVPYTPTTNGGRAPGTTLRPRATWLASLPRGNEVRLTQVVHRAQNDGTCYW